MATYVVVEGITERYVYKEWITYADPSLKCHFEFSDEYGDDDVYIISGNGYPNILNIIEGAVDDVNEFESFTRLIVSIDSEDEERDTRYREIKEFIESYGISKPFEVIVQHFSIEAWALGNKLLFKRNPSDQQLKDYIQIHDVNSHDPELLPDYPNDGLNRAQFAVKYLKALFRERYRNVSYNKRSPDVITHQKYYTHVKARYDTTEHIDSFGAFLECFSSAE